jgi:hypothetical protein
MQVRQMRHVEHLACRRIQPRQLPVNVCHVQEPVGRKREPLRPADGRAGRKDAARRLARDAGTARRRLGGRRRRGELHHAAHLVLAVGALSSK